MLTQKDLDEIEQLTKKSVKEEIKHLPNKDEFFGEMDKVMGELQTIRDENKILNHCSTDNRTRIEKLEDIHPHGKHISA